MYTPFFCLFVCLIQHLSFRLFVWLPDSFFFCQLLHIFLRIPHYLSKCGAVIFPRPGIYFVNCFLWLLFVSALSWQEIDDLSHIRLFFVCLFSVMFLLIFVLAFNFYSVNFFYFNCCFNFLKYFFVVDFFRIHILFSILEVIFMFLHCFLHFP